MPTTGSALRVVTRSAGRLLGRLLCHITHDAAFGQAVNYVAPWWESSTVTNELLLERIEGDRFLGLVRFWFRTLVSQAYESAPGAAGISFHTETARHVPIGDREFRRHPGGAACER